MSFGLSIGVSVLLLNLAYFCKSVKIGGWKSTDTKLSFLISILSSLLILTLFFGFKDSIDINFTASIKKQIEHIQVVMAPSYASE